MNLDQIISEIQQSECVNCKFGKALIALKTLKDEMEPQGGVSVVEAPAADIKNPQRIQKKKSRSVNENPKPRKKRISSSQEEHSKAEKACNKCGEVKPLTAFETNKLCRDGHVGTCKVCRKQQAKDRQALPPQPAATATATEETEEEEREDPDPSKPFECDACGKRFHVRGRLLSHKQFNCKGQRSA